MATPLKILLLEDNPTDAEIIQRVLLKEEMQFEFRLAKNKKLFLQALEDFFPEIILSDNSLPQFNAAEALKITKRLFPHIPFILVTGTVSEEYAANIIKDGADDYILKDRLTRLPAAIEAALKQRRVEKEISDYRYALDQSADVTITDQKGTIVYANENFCRISQYTAEELIGQDHRITNSGYHSASFIKNLWVTIANGKIWHGEFRNKAKDGRFYWEDTTVVPFLDSRGKPYQYLAIRKDITERKKIEEQLSEREKQLELFIERSPASLAMFDNKMRYIAVSRRWITDYNLEKQELIGKTHYEIFPDVPTRWKEIHSRCLRGAIEKNEEDAFTRADGSTSWLRWEIHPWARASGEIGGIIIFTEDITNRKNAIEELLQSQMRLKQAQATAHLGNWEINFETNTSKWSDEAYSIYGLEPGDHNLSVEEWMSFIHPDDVDHIKQLVDHSYSTLKDLSFHHRIVRKDGTIRHVNSEYKFEFGSGGKPIGLYGISHDVTESKEAEEELRQSEMTLKEAQAITHISNWEIDFEQNTHTWSDEFYRIYGTTREEVNPSAELFLSFMHPDDADFAQKKVAEAFQTALNSSFSFRFIRKDGAIRHGYTEWRFESNKKGVPVRLFGILQDITERKEAEAELHRLEQERLETKIEEQKKITRAMLNAQEKERNAIGIELHDNVNQILVATNMALSMTKSNPQKIQELITSSMEHIQEAIQENRKIAHVFVAPDLKTESLVTQLRKLTFNMLKAANIEVCLDTGQFKEALLDTDRKFNIYRIAQEQCTNIVKYSKATKADFVLVTTAKSFFMSVSDDGIGMDTTKKVTGIGIRNIKDRLGLFNGIANIISSPGNGFTLEITIPL